ncbi:MAG: DUF2207 domain-containing protein [Candidatus Aminicenantales bacterium]
MKRGIRIKLFTQAAAFVAAFLLATIGAKAQTKNFYFPQVRIEIQISKDGSFAVDEYRTYEFQGSFSWAAIWIPLRVSRQEYKYQVSIEDFKVLDEADRVLRSEASRKGDRFEAKWYYRAQNARRTFHIHYRIKGGIISYPQVSELYWQVIGSEWDKPAKSVIINIHLPEPVKDKSEILVYGHGPLSGKVTIVDRRTARFTVGNLPARQYVEIRMVWPAGMISGVPSSGHTLASIKREEAAFVQKTIEQARRAQEAKARKKKTFKYILYAWLIWLVLAPLIWLYFYLRYWKRVGKDYSFDDIPDYYRQLPSELFPSLVEVLLREGSSPTPRAFTATIFDLARRGYLELEDRIVEKKHLLGSKKEVETTITLKKDYLNDSKLLPFERQVLDLLFSTVAQGKREKGAKLKLDELKYYLKKEPRSFQKWFQKWQKEIKQESKKLQFIEPLSIRVKNVFLVVSIPVAIATLNPILGLLAGLLTPRIKRRAFPWAREYELWKALGRFLDDFSNFKDLPPEAYKLWEHYLVFGIIFGNAKKILKMLPVVLKDERAAVPTWYYGLSGAALARAGSIASMISSIESMATSIQQASTSAAHYSSGSGGGFSAGGGGGGGGGGGTAG